MNNMCSCCSRPARYRCPRCLVFTCSVECVRLHKVKTFCSGIKSPHFLEREALYSESSLNADYRFLLNVERNIDNATRLKDSLFNNPRNRKPRNVKTLEWVVHYDGAESRFVLHNVKENLSLVDAFTRLRTSRSSPILDQMDEKHVSFHFENPYTPLLPTLTLIAALNDKWVPRYPPVHVKGISVTMEKACVESEYPVQLQPCLSLDRAVTDEPTLNSLPIYYSDESNE